MPEQVVKPSKIDVQRQGKFRKNLPNLQPA